MCHVLWSIRVALDGAGLGRSHVHREALFSHRLSAWLPGSLAAGAPVAVIPPCVICHRKSPLEAQGELCGIGPRVGGEMGR